MISRILKPNIAKSFFLFGPRATGKTTWVKHFYPKALYIDLLESEIFTNLLAHPQRIESFIAPNFKDWVIIDEVQKVPDLMNEVHRLIESRKLKFILTGSSARKLRRGGTNLLAGRALTYHFYPFLACELGERFKLAHSLQYGHLPSAQLDKNPKKYLESYVQTYLEEEIRQEGLSRNLSAFARFLEAASFSQGSVLNISEVARDCAVERKVVENYFQILEDLNIAYRIPVFSKRTKRRMVAHPKFYYFDVGVFRTIRPMGPLDSPEEAEGAAFETLVFQELLAANDLFSLGYTIYYWHTSNDQEVDFVLYGPKGILAFEVKRTGKIRSQHLSGLKSFKKDYPQSKLFFIYGGERKLYEDDIAIIPIDSFVKNIKQYLLK